MFSLVRRLSDGHINLPRNGCRHIHCIFHAEQCGLVLRHKRVPRFCKVLHHVPFPIDLLVSRKLEKPSPAESNMVAW